MKKNIELIFLTCSLLATYSVAGSFVDKRDGRTYKTVKIGEQVWMAENLKYKVSPSYCFGGLESNCQKYGRLYTKKMQLAYAQMDGKFQVHLTGINYLSTHKVFQN